MFGGMWSKQCWKLRLYSGIKENAMIDNYAGNGIRDCSCRWGVHEPTTSHRDDQSQAKLEVAGETRITGLASANYYVCVDAEGDLFESATACAGSDIALKENITPLDGSLSKILNLSPVSFDWIDKSSRGANREIGFIAQDMEKIFPEVVRTNPDGYKGIKYDVFAAVLAKAIQEQNSQLQEVKTLVSTPTNSASTELEQLASM
jgi:hypothetical protein